MSLKTRRDKRYQYSPRDGRPKVTIRNIVTVDSPRRRSPPPRASQDTDYDRAKFLIEERARYWKNLKILYNDYTLVKFKQKELLKCEDNYVNQHCIGETVDLLDALKDKIRAQCKDIVFITNLFGDIEVNPIVESLANGVDIDKIIRKQNKARQKSSVKKTRKQQESASERDVKSRALLQQKSDAPENVKRDKIHKAPPPERRKTSLLEPKFFDSELHWCQVCNVFPPTIKKYLQHLHEDAHAQKVKEQRVNDKPWHTCLPEEQAWRTETTDTVRVKAFNFFAPVNGWFCQLCRSWMGDIHCAATHLRSYVHNMNLKNFTDKFPDWKQNWLDERSKAFEKTVAKDLDVSAGSKEDKKDEDEDETSEEETPPAAEEISRHRSVKTKMWVPNQKAFERVCNEINPVPSMAESKVKSSKKERPPFIGKMPLITSFNKSKKIVMKDLPPNTSEKIVASCVAVAHQSEKPLGDWSKVPIPSQTTDEETDLKLKEFMRNAKKVKKVIQKKKKSSILPIPIDCYNSTDYVPIVENSGALESFIGPVSITQWEADMSYKYHLRHMQQMSVPPMHMMYVPPPQTFLLDPYHAIALHNQQFYGTQHMISNQYENFEIVSRDEEDEILSQYLEHNSPCPSPALKTLKSTDSKFRVSDRRGAQNPTTAKSRKVEAQNKKPEDSKPKRSPSEVKSKPTVKPKPSTSAVIKKPPCLIGKSSNPSTSSSDLLPTFTETFLSNSDGSIPGSSGFISSLLTSCPDVKLVSSNEVYKKRKPPSKRKRLQRFLKKLKSQQTVGEEVGTGEEEGDTTDVDVLESEDQGGDKEEEQPVKDKRLEEMEKPADDEEMVTDNELTERREPSPVSARDVEENESLSLKDKINSMRKQMRNENKDRGESSSRIEESCAKRVRKEQNQEEGDVSEEEDDAKLIFYDMTSI